MQPLLQEGQPEVFLVVLNGLVDEGLRTNQDTGILGAGIHRIQNLPIQNDAELRQGTNDIRPLAALAFVDGESICKGEVVKFVVELSVRAIRGVMLELSFVVAMLVITPVSPLMSPLPFVG